MLWQEYTGLQLTSNHCTKGNYQGSCMYMYFRNVFRVEVTNIMRSDYYDNDIILMSRNKDIFYRLQIMQV